MYYGFGPLKLSDLPNTFHELRVLKPHIAIAVIDDEPFLKTDVLRNHGFNISELGDIKAIDQVMAYPIVICDIKGVGKSFGSSFEGAHLLAEIRKSYPDKYLITCSGLQHNVSYNESLNSADASVTKDMPTEYWTTVLEKGLKSVGYPNERWIRFRKNLTEKGVDAFEIFKLEQSFIKSVKNKDSSIMAGHAVPDEIKELVRAFVSIALSQLILSLSK